MAEEHKASPGGVAYRITLKPAKGASPFANRENKAPAYSEEDVARKLEMAESRRLSFTTQKQVQAASTAQRAQDTQAKVQEEVEAKKKKYEVDLLRDLEEKEQKRLALLADTKERLRKHFRHVDEVRQVLDCAKDELTEKITQCLTLAEERRKQQLRETLEKVKEHEAHVQEVRRNAEEASKGYDLDKHMDKMEATLKNREEQLNLLLERLKGHNIRIENVRKNKQVLQAVNVEPGNIGDT